MAVEGYIKERLVENFKFSPTSCQNNLFDNLARFITGDAGEQWLMLINGYAGTGKTTAIAALIKTLKEFKQGYVLLAPTGRSAKVLANYAGAAARTIHKQIYRQKSLKDGFGLFSLDINKSRNTIFIVDEASLITIGATESNRAQFGSGDLLEDLVTYVRSNEGNRLILMGDPAQLPPIGMDRSPALDIDYLRMYGSVTECWLRSVVRQEQESGILYNATLLRGDIESENGCVPQLKSEGFNDFARIGGGELIEKLSEAIDRYGEDEVVVLCRSNNRANRYNLGIRGSVLFREEQLTRGDKLMIVKNCYQFLEGIEGMDYIANGDIAKLQKISRFEERYGLHFAEARISFPDYDDQEIVAKVILDTLESESASLTYEQSNMLYQGVNEDYAHITTKKKRYEAVREDKYYNALQLKYANAITCHKSQGGQWKCVFIDNPFWQEDLTVDDLKWLYTAVTRATEKVYLVNFKDELFAD